MPAIKPYGLWPSPITPQLITQGVKGFQYIAIDGEDVYWNEMRPSEGGRSVIVKNRDRQKDVDMTPPEYNTRTRVHEYGGTPFVVKDENIYFVNFEDQRLYHQSPEGKIRPLTAVDGPRFADMQVTDLGIFAVAELHENNEVTNFVALIDPETGKYQSIVSGADFYASPRYNPTTKQLAWISWNHPNMPWDITELWIGKFNNKTLEAKKLIAGGEGISVMSPKWSPEGHLYYISDLSGWWNIYRLINGTSENIYPIDAEFGSPLWVLGSSSFAFHGNEVIASYRKDGVGHLITINPETKAAKALPTNGTSFGQVHANNDFVVFQQASPTVGGKIIRYTPSTEAESIIAENEDYGIDNEYISIPEHIHYPSAEGRVAHAYYYAPKNKDYKGPKDTLPPLIVKSHGGPTANADGSLSMKYQYWTSRGFAILDVDYGGSTGYGRAYRSLLNNKWGEVDREDVESGALFLVNKGLVDKTKLAITGGSAEGYTTLNALTFGDVFSVGASYYGVSDLELLAKETHKFESRYLDGLVGPYPEEKERYRILSPSNFTEKLNCPVIFFQGLEDKIVPPNQAELMYEALKKKGIYTELVLYEGEQHGFRKAENIENSLEKELEFYLKVFKAQD